MAHTFDSARFGELAADVHRLALHAVQHEQRLAAFVDALESSHDRRLVETVRELCVAARDQRLSADAIRGGLMGDIPSTDDAAMRRPLVLIVDDSRDNCDMAAMLLETSGYDTLTAANGLEGVLAAHCARPDIVIMDIAMPVLDGREAARLLKASRVTQDINVIAYTARMYVDDVPSNGLFAEVLQKPASPDAIVGVVQRFVVPGEPQVALGG